MLIPGALLLLLGSFGLAEPRPPNMPPAATQAGLISARDTSPTGSNYSQPNTDYAWVRNLYSIDQIKEWFLSLGREYGVNPFIFGAIYVGAIPLFSLSIAWLVRNLRRSRSPVVPTLCASFCFVSAYLYLLVAGQNIPGWVYVFVAGMVAFGVYSTVRKVRARLHKGGGA